MVVRKGEINGRSGKYAIEHPNQSPRDRVTAPTRVKQSDLSGHGRVAQSMRRSLSSFAILNPLLALFLFKYSTFDQNFSK